MESKMYSFRPLSRHGWFPTCFWLSASLSWMFVSVPSRGLGGFLPSEHYWKGLQWKEFPSPFEGWVGAYPISCIPKGNQHTR